LIATVIFGVSGLVMGILNAHQVFLFPALAPAMYPLGTIFGVLFLAPRFGIYGAAWGMVLGALMHLLLQLPSLVRLPQRRYLPGMGLKDPTVRQVVLLIGLPEGSLTAIWYSFGLMMMPEAAIAQSIAIASLPTFSTQVARGHPEEMRASLASTLRAVLLLAVPSSIGLILLRRPLVQLLYPSLSTDMLAWALLWYAAGLVGHSVVEITSRAFYALHDTRTPVMVGVAAMSLNILFSLLFSRGFQAAGLQPHGGLALANSLATGLEMVGLYLLMRRRLKGLHSRGVLRAALAAGAGSLAMAAGLWLWVQSFAGLPSALLVTGGILLGGIIYAGMLAALQVDEFRRGLDWLAARLRPRSNV
jgi:putative peptidoglycan lipid II flippase